jgi:NTE family protein/lysophospholipid hydrolase
MELPAKEFFNRAQALACRSLPADWGLLALIELLRSLSVFCDLNESDLHWLASEIEEVALPAGKSLFRDGDPGDAFYIVRSGMLQVLPAPSVSAPQTSASIEVGDLVGEIAVLYQRPRTSTVSAVTASTLFKISASTLDRLYGANPSAHAQILKAIARRLPSSYLASVPIFAGLQADALRELDLESGWVRLAGGQTLFRQGDAPDYLYVVVQGRLEVLVERDTGQPEIIDQLGCGACVGEMAILTGEPRTATVRAIRDSELVRFSKAELCRLLELHPRGALEMMRILAGRVRPGSSGHHKSARVSTIAIVPLDQSGLSPEWSKRLVETLSAIGGPSLYVSRQRIDAELGGGTASALNNDVSRVRVANWLREREDRFRYVVSECDSTLSIWTDLCLRQADLVLLVASAKEQPSHCEVAQRLFEADAVARPATKELVLVHAPTTRQPSGTAQWLAAYPVSRHHHIRVDHPDDFARLARFIAGKSVGFALSGGGARAFAHLGVMQALTEVRIPIDAVGAVSAGSFVAAFCAMQRDITAINQTVREYVGQSSLVGDITLPLVSFLSARKVVRLLRQLFEDIRIEDLWLPFFCLSANLSTAKVVVHDQGPLWMGIRATTSIPGILPPLCVASGLLVDGGVLNNLPADIMRSRGSGTVIASDVSLAVDLTTESNEQATMSGWPLLWNWLNPWGKKPTMPHIFEILMRTATLSSIHHAATVAHSADHYIHTQTQGVSMLDWNAGTVLVERGYRQALQEIATWQNIGGFHS